MANSFQCEIVSAEQSLFSGEINQLVVTGVMGELGILAGHTPLLTELQPGPLRVIREGDEEEIYYVTGGFIEVQPNIVSVLADTATRAHDIDEASAEEARKEALRSINEQKSDLDYSRATAELAEAVAQLRTLEKLRQKGGRR
ncbi:F0F1 ATP synthase subunit epsilon [Halomonas sp. McH1-25]|uniref:F0F1 ATP synthase subunit epsilon n=1 Tax=unclassified Halomonas TaxID=2609666 RepID=UPI001EF6E20F|nr:MULTISPECIES: F0F1 ATP synthase subunit epsilon [unclassified Halomonas]MCG7599655.1 F0F1 ATP synthase subunit epsilon [Halomonas sp. McH1-25]MCP1342575.1 F0F1 ATP synthase subunit epsilon [Halomonas sp. FL8]MCP1361427.1 F0F1 ATP synthase subunit epsilon [Halomonas sp. BBD45]MCP1364605.1 F0F1 ATP synthase subunit epsilon [Halomonas sp. BBD48]